MQLRTFAADDPGDWDTLIDMAVAADTAGIDRLALSDHVAFGNNLDAYGDPSKGGSAGGKQPTGPDGHWLEPLTVASVLTGITSHARFQTGVLLAALRRPAVLAKQLATLDVLSKGRIDLGVGVGWQKEEYDACGLEYGTRGTLLNDTLEALQALWTQPVAGVDNSAASFGGIHAMPKPAQAGGIPIWVSGTLNTRVMDRMVRFGSGWIPWGPDAANPTEGLAQIREAFAAAGRDMTGFNVTSTLPFVRDDDGTIDVAASMDAVGPLAEAGITDFRAYVPTPDGREEATEYLGGLVNAFRTAVGR